MRPLVRYGLRLAVVLAPPSGGGARAGGYIFQTIDVPGSVATVAFGINGAGQIVGQFDGSHGFLDSGGVFTTIDVPGASETTARGINDRGQIVGYSSSNAG